MLESINNRLAQTGAIDTPDTTAAEVVDSMVQADALASRLDSRFESGLDSTANAAHSQTISLFSKLMPVMDQQGRVGEGPVVGYANAAGHRRCQLHVEPSRHTRDASARHQTHVGCKAMKGTDVIYELFAIKANTRQQKARLDGSAITEARAEYSEQRRRSRGVYGNERYGRQDMGTPYQREHWKLHSHSTSTTTYIPHPSYTARYPADVRASAATSHTTRPTTWLSCLNPVNSPAPARIIQGGRGRSVARSGVDRRRYDVVHFGIRAGNALHGYLL